MDLPKAFDCVPLDVLIAKLHVYRFSEKTVTFIYSYLKRRKQNVKIENFYSDFLTLLSGVPQGSILGPILFNLFLNDLLATLKMSELYNFADDNTISTASKNMSNLIQTLVKESETAVSGFNQNKMVVSGLTNFKPCYQRKEMKIINHVLRSIIRQLQRQIVSNYWE